MINSKKELNKEELENVNGGRCGAPDEYLPSDHGPHIGQYDAEHYLNQKFYVVWDADNTMYYTGTLIKSWEKPWTSSTTKRTHLLYIESRHNGDPDKVGKNVEFDGCNVTLYLCKK